MADAIAVLRLGSAAPGRPTRAFLGESIGVRVEFVDATTGALVTTTAGVSGTATNPSGAASSVTMTQESPGVWTGAISMTAYGGWVVTVGCLSPDVAIASGTITCSAGADVTAPPVAADGSAVASAALAAQQAAVAVSASDAADADATQTALDRTAVAADLVQTTADRAAVAADLVQTQADAAAVEADRIAVAAAKIAAEAAADTTATNVANAAIQAATLAALTTAMSASAEGALGVVYGVNADEGNYRKISGNLVRYGDTLRQQSERVRGAGSPELQAAIGDEVGNAIALFSPTLGMLMDGTTLNSGGVSFSGFGLNYNAGLPYALNLLDPAGNVTLGLADAGLVGIDFGLSATTATFAGLTYAPTTETVVSHVIVDSIGNAFAVFTSDGRMVLSDISPTDHWPVAEILARDLAQRLLTEEGQRQILSGTMAPTVAGRNLFASMGQSLSLGNQSNPVHTRAAKMPNDLLMFGACERPIANATTAVPFVSATFQALVAKTEGTGVLANGLLTQAEADALPYGDAAQAESPLCSFLHQFRRMQLSARGIETDPATSIVACAIGKGGTVLATHQKGDPAGTFARYLDNATRFKAAADLEGKTSQIGAVYWSLGTSDSSNDASAIIDEAGHAAALVTLMNDHWTDIASGVFGQRQRPAWIMQQTRSLSATPNMGVQMAQIKVAREQPGVFLVGPEGAYPDKGTHLTANGSRMAGAQAAKVLYWTQVLKRPWPVFAPTSAVRRGRHILLSFPNLYPLVFDLPFDDAGRANARADQGFTVWDNASTALPIGSVSIVGTSQVLVSLASVPSSAAFIRQGGHEVGSHTFLRDTDPTRAEDVWEFVAGSNQDAGENTVERLGLPYPLWNWCCAFHTPITVE